MLQARHIAYSPGPLAGVLFEDLDLALLRREVVCLTGPNGAGKTALVELLAGLRKPASGYVALENGTMLAYVPQDVDPHACGSLASSLLRDPRDLQDRARLKKSVARLGLDPDRLDEPASNFSIGELVRAAIAAAAMAEPDLLLLDEPTNHLDVDGKEWVVRFLGDWPGACLMVCHDRTVIDKVASRTLILDRGKLQEYAGGYTAARAEKAAAEARAKESYERNKSEQRRLKIAAERTLQRAGQMSRRPTGRTYDPKAKPYYGALQAKLDRRAAAIKHRVEHVASTAAEKPFEPDSVDLRFNSRPLRSPTAVSVRGLWHDFGNRELFQGLNLTLMRGDRVALLGPNGSGKTTLMRILLGEIEPKRGEVECAGDLTPAYLTQGREQLDPSMPLREAIGGDEPTVRVLLGCLGLRYQASDKLVSMLSVGERTKAELVALLLSPANLLLLDEPTNHLDVPAMEALETALLQFPGCVIFASHDMAFVERVATEVVRL